ncbi:MAG: hypothetical protein A2451_14455 [Bdellovibrionales bacterium RIFOXYC2_FULL_39_8]|nr:MAG: hypothetical protein A2404_02375 [Bdellovibrionales bacterium RIFOXYC1_FULL_39_130]OFZ71470.1 MAG: hypothetical protein A2451_14455 [Bdellovibrionales bacterium RIFOXYC2_FULL_39_8]OFZ75165.1 MAG: hypothetical protein A2560_03335 [Bdellovibrionales bacterium RIFOXYD1_FULL_39_84]HLE12266.1 hypothetical protein [Bacteriovoracaceae bacterium]
MKLLVLFHLLFLFYSCAHLHDSGNGLDPSDIVYTFEPKTEGESSYLLITVKFRGDADGVTRVNLPTKWAGQTELYKETRNLQIIQEGQKLEPVSNAPGTFEIKHRPSLMITITYELYQSWKGEINEENYYRPLFDKCYFHIIGFAGLLMPDWDGDKKINISFVWKNLPKNWAIANSFGVNEKEQTIVSSLGEIQKAIYVAGDFEIKKIIISNNPVYVAIRGKWKFDTNEFYDLIGKTIKADREFWNDFDFPFFLITMIPMDEKQGNKGGTGLTNSFALFSSKDTNKVSGFVFLLMHEYFHTWNGVKIKREEPEELVYWFSEGFTNYYTNLLNLRAGIISLADYVELINKSLKKYYFSPVINESNERILKDFWNDKNVEKLPYQRGEFLALNWNAAIKKVSDYSLDNVMKDILSEAIQKGTLVSGKVVDRIIRSYLKDGVLNDLELYIEKGNTISPSPLGLGHCVSLNYVKAHKYDLGFDFVKSRQNKIVMGVAKSGAAYKAGLRDGQVLRSWSVWTDKIDEPTEMVIGKSKKEEKIIKYYPVGSAEVDIPQYVLDTDKFEKDANQCLAWFR